MSRLRDLGYRHLNVEGSADSFRQEMVRSRGGPANCGWLTLMPRVETRYSQVNGVRLRITDAGPPDGPVVVLAHGFPELAFSWRHQIPVLADAGFRVLAPDQRGYGGSSRPSGVEAYDIAALTADLIGLLDEVDAERAALIGHDWGAVVAWSAALLHPERVAAVAGLSVPPVPRPQTPPTAAFRRIFGENFFYILYFQQPGPADAEMDGDPHRALRRMLGGMRVPGPGDEQTALRMLTPGPAGFIDRLPEPAGLPDWLSREELDTYVSEFTRTGFTGALNWYRNFDRNWQIMADAAHTTTAPALFVGGTADPALAFIRADRAAEVVVGDYREVMLEGAGHWIQQERPEEINSELLTFLARVGWS